MTPETPGPEDGTQLTRTLADFRAAGRSDVTFGGPVSPNAQTLEITSLNSTNTRALQGLRVRTGQGLGGKALAVGRPVSVLSYPNARGITRHYDTHVQREQLETMTAIPIMVDATPRMVVYLGHRNQVALGDVWYDSLRPLVRRLERDIGVHDEVNRRLRSLPHVTHPAPTAPLNEAELHDISEELASLAALVLDPALRTRLETVQNRLRTSTKTGRSTPAHVKLTARELEVLHQVALGLSNREVAIALGLVENTVKSYLKSATRKLSASNRVHAVRLAREAGLVS